MILLKFIIVSIFYCMGLYNCSTKEARLKNEKQFLNLNAEQKLNNNMIDTLTVGGGCFWCVEAQLLQLKGVQTIASGYAGGNTINPTYKEVCSGKTNHAEVIQITFDNVIISLDELLAAFWQSHDPTQLNRQGNDVGTQYRSIILYRNQEQKEIAELYKKKLNDEKVYEKEVVTEIALLTQFYAAESEHQNYYNLNKDQPYCQYVIAPKLEKFNKIFKEKIK